MNSLKGGLKAIHTRLGCGKCIYADQQAIKRHQPCCQKINPQINNDVCGSRKETNANN